MMPHVDYKNVGSSFYIDMGNQKKDVVVSARKKGCNKYQITQGCSTTGVDPKLISGYKETTGIMYYLWL